MARTQVTKLWTTIITALLSLFTALGLITTTAAPAVAHPEHPRNTTTATATTAEPPLWDWSQARSLPPTMKQRIRAEAHGKSPNCRHLPRTDADALLQTCPTTDGEAPLQN
ncbi:DUF6344 domain-containing protein [Streptomyces sp. 4F14]|uniref:DUF6344 domain-containing protein n=1 Tax=Streptomyces sp. 4F14 TaxID=3394380 RepID=UPI003A87FC28